jgi:hypothetical protein
MRKTISIISATLVLSSGIATADDLSAAAKNLGLTDDDVAACQNPQ